MILITNVGYTSFLVGDWDAALTELDVVLADDLDRLDRVVILSNALIVRTCRGESIDAGLLELDALLADTSDISIQSMAQDTRANLALAQGRLEEARSIWNHMADVIGGYGPAAIYAAARGGAWAGDADAVRADLARLDATGFHGPVVEVRRTTLQAALAALEGRTTDALAL